MAFKMNGFPAHRGTSMAKQKLNKGGEGQDQNKIFNDKGEHVGDYVNGKPVMKLKELVQKEPKLIEARKHIKRPAVKIEPPSNFAEIKQKPLHTGYEKMVDPAFQTNRGKAKPMATIAKQVLTGPEIPHGQETFTKGFTSDSDYEGIVNDKKNSRSYIRKYDKMSEEDLAKAKIRNTGQTVIRAKDDKSKNARKITIRKGPDKRT